MLEPRAASRYGAPVKTDDFDYELPPELIAQQPADRRDESRMMVVHRATGSYEHTSFKALPGYLRKNDIVVVNNTKVIPARLIGEKPRTGGKVEIFLVEPRSDGHWDVLIRTSRRPRPGEIVSLAGGELTAVMIEDGVKGRAVVHFNSDRPILEWAEKIGGTPLPPYIRRPDQETAGDRERYQTIYARHAGAVAAPTAGLHFTPETFDRLASMGVHRAELTLHVGLGTFRPVTADLVADHRMDQERYVITREAANLVQQAKHAGGRCLAVGSTSVRTLESVAARHGAVIADEGRTDLFIYPPFTFRVVDMILTNFHLPKSTLLMMMSAFAGRDLMLDAYREAVREKYRFFSYGDCMLII